MSKETWSVDAVLASLEARAALLREREAFHAGHEAHHREQRSAAAAELADVARRLEAFRAAAAEAVELAAREASAAGAAAAPEPEPADLGSASRPKLGRMASFLIAAKAPTDPFGPATLAREVNRRFADRLRRPATAAQMSIILRRLHRQGKIHKSRPGRPHWEALYTRQAPAP